MLQYWLLTGLAIIFFVNAFWLLFMGNYADRGTQDGKFRTYEFERNPIGYSFSVGLILVLGFACLQYSNPQFFALAVKKVPQLNYLITVAKMKDGLYYLIGGGFVACSMLAFLIRRTITTTSTFTKGHELDLDPRALKMHQAKIKSDTPDWQREGDRKSSQFDDGTPL